MKTIFTQAAFMALSFAPLSLLATTLTVSNNPHRPAQFTTVQGAIDAAAPNDTILITAGIYGSSSGKISTTKPLVIYGEGALEGDELPATAISGVDFQFKRLNAELSSCGSKIYGIDFRSGTVSIDGNFFASREDERGMADFLFEGCAFTLGRRTSINMNAAVSNVAIRNCIFTLGHQPYGSVLNAVPYDNMHEVENIFEQKEKPIMDGCPLTQRQVDILCQNVSSKSDPSPGAPPIFDWAFEENLAKFFGIEVKPTKTQEEEDNEWYRVILEISKKLKVCTPALICKQSMHIGFGSNIMYFAILSDSTEVFDGFIVNLEPDINYIHPYDKFTALDTICSARNHFKAEGSILRISQMNYRYNKLKEMGAKLNYFKESECE